MDRWKYCGQRASIRGVWGRILETQEECTQEECTKCLFLNTDFQESVLGLLGNIKDLLMLEVMTWMVVLAVGESLGERRLGNVLSSGPLII